MLNPIQFFTSKLQAFQTKGQYNKLLVKSFKTSLQAFGEAGHDINVLTPEILENAMNRIKQPDKNNYKTYVSQIEAIHKMYYAEADYGGELARGLIDTRAALLCGEGVNVIVLDSEKFLEEQKDKSPNPPAIAEAGMPKDEPEEEVVDEKKEAVKTFINDFIDWNRLEGAGLIEIAECGEREGKVLLVLNSTIKNEKKIINIEVFDYYTNKYKLLENGNIQYTKDQKPITIPSNRFVFVQLSGSKKDIVKTPPRMANVLTQIENYSREKYDLRKNNHLFAKAFLWFETQDMAQANSIKNYISNNKFTIGVSGAGPAKPHLVNLVSGASQAINDERIMDIKDIATTMGIPIMLMNYPELMSNRATAETMMEMINQSTKKERLIYQDDIKELIQKAMKFAQDELVEGAVYEPDMFEVNLPLITMDNLKALVETWCVLFDKKMVSKKTVQGKIPGINPLDEEQQIQEETKENIINNPIIQGTIGYVDPEEINKKEALIKEEK